MARQQPGKIMNRRKRMTFKMKRNLVKTAIIIAMAVAAAILVVLITQLLDRPIQGGYYPHDDERGGSGRRPRIISFHSPNPVMETIADVLPFSFPSTMKTV
jgi:hypothetical protein